MNQPEVISMNGNPHDIYPFTRKELLTVGLRYNPFNPGGESDLHKFFVDRDDAISRIVNQFEEIVNEERMKVFFIMGEEGLGRTSILRVLEYEFGKGFKNELESRINEMDELVKTLTKRIEEINSIKEHRDNLQTSLKTLKNYKDATDILSKEVPDRLKDRIKNYFEARESEKEEEIEKLSRNIEEYIRISILKSMLGQDRIPNEEIEKLLTSGNLEVSWKEIRSFCQRNLQEIEKIVFDRNKRAFDQLRSEMVRLGLRTTKKNHEELIQEYDEQLTDEKTESSNAEKKYLFGKQQYDNRSRKFESLIITDKGRLIRGQVIKNEVLFMRTLIGLVAEKTNLSSREKNEEFFDTIIQNIKENCLNRELVRLFQNDLENTGYTAEDFVDLYAFNGTVKRLLDIFVETSSKCRPKLSEEEAVLIFLEFLIQTLGDFFTAFIFLFDDASYFGGRDARGVRGILVHLFENEPCIFVFAVNWTNKLPTTYGELFSRFGEPTDLTSPAFLTKADSERSIRLRLNSARIEELEVLEPFEPFSVAAIDEIIRESRKVPIFWVYMCYHALEILRSRIPDGQARVTVEMAREAIQKAWSDIVGRMSENQRTILFALVRFKNLGAPRLAEVIHKDLGNTSKNLAMFRRMQLLAFKNIPRPKPKTQEEERKREYQLSTYKAYSLAIPSLEEYLRNHEDECPFEFSE
jgi:hypothetical protein